MLKHFTKFLVLGLLGMAGVFKESHFKSALVEIQLKSITEAKKDENGFKLSE